MVAFVLVKVDMHMWSYSYDNEINAPDVICGKKLALVHSLGSIASWIFPSCVSFNNFPFGS